MRDTEDVVRRAAPEEASKFLLEASG